MAVAPSRGHNRDLTALQVTWFCWMATEWAVLVAVSVVALDRWGVAAVGLVGAFRVLPGALLGPVEGMLVDRLPRARVLAGVLLSWVGIALALAVASTRGPLWLFLLVLLVGSLTAALAKPCVRALLPQLVHTPQELVRANATYGALEGLGTVLGPVLSGALLAAGPRSAFLVIAAVYAVAGLAALLIRTPNVSPPPRRRTLRPTLGRTLARRETGRGVATLLAPDARDVFVLIMGQTTLRGLLNVFVVVLAAEAGGSSGTDGRVAALFAVVGVGGVLGSVLASRLRLGQHSAVLFAVGMGLWSLGFLLMAAWPSLAVAALSMVLIGLGNALEDVYGLTVLDRLVPEHVAGRTYAVFWSCAAGTVALGSVLADPLLDLLGLSGALLLSGGGYALVVLFRVRRLRRLDRLAQVAREAIPLLRGAPPFAVLSEIVLDRLAHGARERRVGDGQAVVCEGEIGSEYAVIRDGTVVVSRRGSEVAVLGPGDGFGEIALVDAVPRTATVTARGTVDLVCVDADTFVGAVCGHLDAGGVARRHVDELRTRDRLRDADDGS